MSSSAPKRSGKKPANKTVMSKPHSSSYAMQRSIQQQQSLQPSHEYGYSPYSNYPYRPPYQPLAPPNFPPIHSTAQPQFYQRPTGVGVYDDHSSYMSMMMQTDQSQQPHLTPQQTEVRDREAMQNLQRQFSYGYVSPTTEENVETSTEEAEEDANEDANVTNSEEFNEEYVAPSSPEYNQKKTKWKSLNGIFSKRHQTEVESEPDPGIEDIEDDHAEGEGIAADGRKKQCKFTSEQYVSLAKSWIRISQDSIVGNNMKGQKFWERVAEFYNSLEARNRTWASLRGGYRVMNAACQNYLAILTGLQNRQQSGAAPYDVIEESRKAYQQKYGHPFKFQDCFELLSSLPKWKNPSNFMFEQQNKARRMNYSDSSPGSDPSSQERNPLFGTSDGRPVGRAKSIQLEQRGAEFSRFMETIENSSKATKEHRARFSVQRNRSDEEFQKAVRDDRELRRHVHTEKQAMVREKQEEKKAMLREKQEEKKAMVREKQEEKKAMVREKLEETKAMMREKNYIKMITCDFSKLSPLQQELVTEQIGEYRKNKGSGSGSGSYMD